MFNKTERENFMKVMETISKNSEDYVNDRVETIDGEKYLVYESPRTGDEFHIPLSAEKLGFRD